MVIILLFITKAQFPFKAVRTWAKTRYNSIVWNGLIQFYHDTHLVLSVIGWLSLKELRFGSEYTRAEQFSSVLSIILVIFSIAFPVGLHYNLSKKLKRAKTKD